MRINQRELRYFVVVSVIFYYLCLMLANEFIALRRDMS